jgi:PAS domain S-box-containing protein
LLVEDNLPEARLLQELLQGVGVRSFRLDHVKRLAEAIARLQAEAFDAVLLDLTLPDSYGLASLDTLIQQAPSLPVVVLTNTNDDDLAVQAVRHGAQDYLVKRLVTQDMLVRSLRYAIERKQAAEALREANEILELRVRQRTAELETANDRLLQEVQQRQTVQERLELAQQAGKIGSFEWHLPSQQVTWTAELEGLYGLAAGSLGDRAEDWLATLHPEDRPKVEQELQQALSSGRGLETEFRILWPDGSLRWIAVKSSLFHDTAGIPLRLIGIHMDITEKKQLEAQFLWAQRLESLGTLASGIAHDLNNILTPILAVVQLLPLKLPDLTPQTWQMLHTLESSAQRGADLVKQILSFARGVEGKRVNLQVQHLLLEIEKIIQQTLPKSIAIHTDLPNDLWMVVGDATQLHQVFMNLCVNARDAMPQGGTLSITADNLLVDEPYARMHLDARMGPYVVVTISDTGMGIAAEIVHRIFDPFFTTKAVGQGTGLGLSAVLGIVKSHGGFVEVHSQVNQGSQFKVYLPAQRSVQLQTSPTLDPLMGDQEWILVVDDEASICEITKVTLETHNYQVLTASDGIEAIAVYAQHKDEIHSVLMDLMMPAMDGASTLIMLRRLNPEVFAIAMSGLNSTEAVAQAEQLGFQRFLAKPFTTRELLQVLHHGQVAG